MIPLTIQIVRMEKDIKVLSYNNNPLKELLEISVISTDFNMMGDVAAHMILNNEKRVSKKPFKFIGQESV
tara:strand:- start:397 stop:606 length:210 start_codon:yes stop_codon:yes gene_type:complete